MTLTQDQKLILAQSGLFSTYNILTSFYLAAYALALGASNTAIGVLGAIPYIAIVIGEIPGAKLTERFHRRTIALVSTAAGRLTWIAIILAPVLFASRPLFGITLLYLVASIVQDLGTPSWVSIMADLVPKKIRGAFFGQRLRAVEVGAAIATLLGGWYLDLYTPGSLTGFMTLMGAGVLAGLASTAIIRNVTDKRGIDKHHHSLKEFFHADGSFHKYLVFVGSFMFAVMLASPFFTVYMLKDLGMSYTAFAVSTVLTNLAKILSLKPIGRLSDRIGDKQLAVLSVIGASLVPLSFMFITRETRWLVFPAQAYSGIVWAGVDLLLFNLFLDHSNPGKRPIQTAEYSIAQAVPSAIAPILGGMLADVQTAWLTGIPLVFAVATILRLATVGLLVRVPEKRGKEMPVTDVIATVLHQHPNRGAEIRVHRAKG